MVSLIFLEKNNPTPFLRKKKINEHPWTDFFCEEFSFTSKRRMTSVQLMTSWLRKMKEKILTLTNKSGEKKKMWWISNAQRLKCCRFKKNLQKDYAKIGIQLMNCEDSLSRENEGSNGVKRVPSGLTRGLQVVVNCQTLERSKTDNSVGC